MTAKEKKDRRQLKVMSLHIEGLSSREIGKKIGVGKSTVNRDLGDLLEAGAITSDNSGFGALEDKLLYDRLNPNDFQPTTARLDKNDQLKVGYRYKPQQKALFTPIQELAQAEIIIKGNRPKLRKKKGEGKFWIIVTDRHLGLFHNPALHEASLKLAQTIQPENWVDLGDTVNVDQFGRFASKDPGWVEPFAEEITQAIPIAFGDPNSCLPKETKKFWFPANHSWRWITYCMENMPGMLDLQLPGKKYPHFHLGSLMHLEEFGFEYVGSNDGPDYPYAELEVDNTGLFLIHGHHCKKGSGNSVRAAIAAHHRSYAMGHVHDEASIKETYGENTYHGYEIPAMAKSNLRYHKFPNHQEGFAIIESFGDTYTFEFPQWDIETKTLTWRGDRYKG